MSIFDTNDEINISILKDMGFKEYRSNGVIYDMYLIIRASYGTMNLYYTPTLIIDWYKDKGMIATHKGVGNKYENIDVKLRDKFDILALIESEKNFMIKEIYMYMLGSYPKITEEEVRQTIKFI